jgi:hypothetical protein
VEDMPLVEESLQEKAKEDILNAYLQVKPEE